MLKAGERLWVVCLDRAHLSRGILRFSCKALVFGALGMKNMVLSVVSQWDSFFGRNDNVILQVIIS